MARPDQRKMAEEFAARIIDALEKGTAPWTRQWKPGEYSPPFNPVSETVYSGVNFINLSVALDGHHDPRWMTLRQANGQGWKIRKGSKSEPIIYWNFYKKKMEMDVIKDGEPLLDQDGKPVTELTEVERPFLKVAHVFHASQVEGIPPWEGRDITWNPNDRAETILANSEATILHEQRNRAFYRPATDEIHMPTKASFETDEQYYSTVLHELGHWTGHSSRLDRGHAQFGTEEYAREELRAEIASWMLCSEIGLGHEPQQYMNYIGSWVQALKEDPMEIFRAARDAEKIKAYALEFEQGKRVQAESETSVAGTRDAREQTKQSGAAQAAPDRIYLNVPYSEKEEAKAAGAKWDRSRRSWYLPGDGDPGKAAKWMEGKAMNTEPENGAPKRSVSEKTWLTVPYAEKNRAKAAGARWDRGKKLWYLPKGGDLAKVSQWMPERQAVQVSPAMTPQAEFAQALRDAGLDLQGQLPVMDGKMHRVPLLDSKPGRRDGMYKGFLDGRPAGYIQNHKTGLKTNWKSSGHGLTEEQKVELRAEAAEKQAQRSQDLKEQYDQAAQRGEAIYKQAAAWFDAGDRWKTLNHPYMESKGLGGIRTGTVIDKHGNLLLPGTDPDGKIQTLQFIAPDGTKRYLKGGRKQGASHLVFTSGLYSTRKDDPIFIAEGFATAVSASKALNQPVHMAFDAGNLKAVARSLKQREPERPVVILGDNDHHLEHKGGVNAGLLHAMEAAKSVDGRFVVPHFNRQETARGLTDFNDLHVSRGLDAVKAQINEALAKVSADRTQSFTTAHTPRRESEMAL